MVDKRRVTTTAWEASATTQSTALRRKDPLVRYIYGDLQYEKRGNLLKYTGNGELQRAGRCVADDYTCNES